MPEVVISRPDKVLFPAGDGFDPITKGQLAAYYERVAPVMLPHLAGRPITMHRLPDGLGKKQFFQKAAPEYAPEWIPRATVPKAGGSLTHLLCDSAACLLWMTNQASLTPHVWLSRADRPQHPDRFVVDLDPSVTEPLDVAAVRWAAHTVRDALAEAALTSFVMTTGSKGFHVVVPLDRSERYEAVSAVGEALAARLEQRHPGAFTTAFAKAKRQGRIYLDVRRNGYAQTQVAPYGVRARLGAPVATPIAWDELDTLQPASFNLANLFERLDQKGDPWADIDAAPTDLAGLRTVLSTD